ncbi:MAG: BACON domain-containing protein [Flavobacteriaceae bacterium]|jgi:hypothetical protein|nr:BACON domain-containing protein [Flavobacteriaceae bacterium]
MKASFTQYSPYVLLLLVVIQFFIACSPDDNKYGFAVADPNLKISQATHEVTKDSGTKTVSIEANLPWRANSTANWITINKVQGDAGSHELILSFDKNSAIEERKGIVEVWINSTDKQKIVITQEAASLEDTYTHYYVKPNGTGDGSSWEKAANLSSILALALNNNDIIHLTEGKYIPAAHPLINTNQEKDFTFLIQSNIKIIGGYPTDATTNSKPDNNRQTILSGNNASVHVVTVLAQKISNLFVQLENITITEGNADAAASNLSIKGFTVPRDHGAGIITMESNLSLNNCKVINNKSGRHAAGMFVTQKSNVIVKNSMINDNVGLNSNSNAGGIFINNASMSIYHTDISNNRVGGVAGGIQTLTNSEVNMYNVSITNNQSNSNAGGFYHRGNSKAALVNCYFYNNVSTEGGAISTHDGAVMSLISSTLYKNESKKLYGAINNQANNTIAIYNSLLFDNFSTVNNNGINPVGQINFYSSAIHQNIYDENEQLQTSFSNKDLDITAPLAIKPISANSPIALLGMSTNDLMVLRNKLNLFISAEEITVDLNNKTREKNKTIGAYTY